MSTPKQTDLTLYELVTHPDGGKTFSPFVWATKFDLARVVLSDASER